MEYLICSKWFKPAKITSIVHAKSTVLWTLTPDEIVDRQVADGLIPADLKEKISFVLLRKHRHQTKKPIHRSLADMGKSSNTAPSKCVFVCVCVPCTHFQLPITKLPNS